MFLKNHFHLSNSQNQKNYLCLYHLRPKAIPLCPYFVMINLKLNSSPSVFFIEIFTEPAVVTTSTFTVLKFSFFFTLLAYPHQLIHQMKYPMQERSNCLFLTFPVFLFLGLLSLSIIFLFVVCDGIDGVLDSFIPFSISQTQARLDSALY